MSCRRRTISATEGMIIAITYITYNIANNFENTTKNPRKTIAITLNNTAIQYPFTFVRPPKLK